MTKTSSNGDPRELKPKTKKLEVPNNRDEQASQQAGGASPQDQK